MSDADLGRLINEHHVALLRYVRWRTFGDWQLAEDIVQETLLRVWLRPQPTIEAYTSLRPWLFTVARNLLFDHLRARRARPAEVYGGTMEVPHGMNDEIDMTLTRFDMMRALDRLSPLHRTVLIEVYYHRRSLTEIAEVLDVPFGTVKSRIFYALRALKVVIMGFGVPVPGCGLPAVASPAPSKRHDHYGRTRPRGRGAQDACTRSRNRRS